MLDVSYILLLYKTQNLHSHYSYGGIYFIIFYYLLVKLSDYIVE